MVSAFTKNGKGGNPAGVVLNADDLSSEQKQCIAKQLNLSETAFISQKRDLTDVNTADFSVSFYTPTQEVDFCGHATLAAFSCLLEQGVITCGRYVQLTNVGELPVDVNETGLVTIGQAPAQFFQCFKWHEIEPLINPTVHLDCNNRLPIQVVYTGLKDCFIPLPKGALDKLTFDLPLIARFCEQHDLIGFHLFELEESSNKCLDAPIRAQCRNIAPLVGIDEESATGSSSGALACYLNYYLAAKPTEFEFEQGRKMGSLSQLSVSLKVEEEALDINSKSQSQVPYVSGSSVIIGKKEVALLSRV